VTVGADQLAWAKLADGIRLEQLRDDSYTVAGEDGRRAPGWLAAEGNRSAAGLICRDFWQLYPKAIGAEDGMLYLDICPELSATEYNDCTERELYKLYYYLQDGVYKVRQGVTKIHDVWVSFARMPLDPSRLAGIPAWVNEAPILAASPDYYAASGVFGDFVPETAGRTPRYDDLTARAYRGYVDRRESSHEFGMLNYGDQWGERGANWANGEYDHHHTAAQMFVRNAEPGWHSLMQAMARHDIDVDLCHYDASGRQGGSWTHSIGHTGSYLDTQMEGKFGSPRAGQSPTHTWTAGTCDYYMLTGDPTAIEAARMISDHYGGGYINHYDFTNGRVPGWHLIQVMATYRTTYDPFYLNAARIIIERVLERRTPGGGWDRQLVPGHCHCEPRCRGLCSFMQGILGVGLREYWRETRDDRIPPAVVDSARHVLDEIWVEEQESFRYTSCPTSSVTASRADTLGGLMLFAYEHSGDPRLLDAATRGLNKGLDSTTSMAHLRWTPYLIYATDLIERDGLALGGDQPVQVTLREDEGDIFQLRALDRDGVGAPQDVLELTSAARFSATPDDNGRIVVDGATGGDYHLTVTDGPWLLTSNLSPMVVSIADGLQIEASEATRWLYLMPKAGAERISVTLTPIEGKVKARLLAPDGTQLAKGAKTLAGPVTDAGLYQLELTGPGRVTLSAEGVTPWASLLPGRWFNASAPTVNIDGNAILMPGEGRTVRLTATIDDPEADGVTILWQLPDGTTREGAELVWEPAGDGPVEIAVVVTDAAGNVGSATHAMSLPPAELADAQTAVIVQAEDFSAQGDGQVEVCSRNGNVGQMITKWHADAGHWLEWTIQVPADGEYALWARYATDSPTAHRSLTIDGEIAGEDYGDVEFVSTGGFCTSVDNWAMRRMGAPVALTAGEHTIRMANLGEGLAMDYLAIVKVD